MIASPRPALLLTRREIAALMAPQDYLAAVEAGFRCYARRKRRPSDADAHRGPQRRLPRQGRARGARSLLRGRQAEWKFPRQSPAQRLADDSRGRCVVRCDGWVGVERDGCHRNYAATNGRRERACGAIPRAQRRRLRGDLWLRLAGTRAARRIGRSPAAQASAGVGSRRGKGG